MEKKSVRTVACAGLVLQENSGYAFERLIHNRLCDAYAILELFLLAESYIQREALSQTLKVLTSNQGLMSTIAYMRVLVKTEATCSCQGP